MSHTLTPARTAALPHVWNAVTTLRDDTKAEYFYDYAGQDPINGYDLTGTVHAPPGGPFGHSTLSGMCVFDPGYCGSPGSFATPFKAAWKVVSSRSCLVGAGAATLAAGPEAAIGGCVFSYAISQAEKSKNEAVKVTAYVVSFASAGRTAVQIVNNIEREAVALAPTAAAWTSAAVIKFGVIVTKHGAIGL